MERMIGSSTLEGRFVVSVLGRATETPWWSIGAVTMKMIRRTSMTSTSGVTLMSARLSYGSPEVRWKAIGESYELWVMGCEWPGEGAGASLNSQLTTHNEPGSSR